MNRTQRAVPVRIAELLLAAATLLAAGALILQCADVFITGTAPQNLSETGVYIRDVYSRELVAQRLADVSWAFVLWLAALVAAAAARAIWHDERRDVLRLSAESRLALARERVAASDAMLAQQRKRRLAGAVCAAVCAGCAVAVCLYLLDTAHFASRDLESVMGAMLAHTAPWIALAFAALAAYAQLRSASIERELDAAMQAPKREPEPRPAQRTSIAVVGRVILCLAAIALIVAGILNGGMYDVLVKAINICTECIGLG